MILSVDRLDYTKGIPERLKAFRKFLIKNPEYADKVVFVQIAVPSRTQIPDYKHLKDQVEMLVLEINEEFEHLPDAPIYYIYRSFPFEKLCAFYSEADIALITPYFDGMNLISKEYIVTKKENGVLILSELAGAASELGEALIVNPRNPDQIALAIKEAIKCP
ncbi:MAG: hypothetical protein KatS3mg129_0505 [Leptospiraceae bacterium]|nr:MAG: hypothetical protein KatS3mg129_0505 [Leptospiraceae bacterium]